MAATERSKRQLITLQPLNSAPHEQLEHRRQSPTFAVEEAGICATGIGRGLFTSGSTPALLGATISPTTSSAPLRSDQPAMLLDLVAESVSASPQPPKDEPASLLDMAKFDVFDAGIFQSDGSPNPARIRPGEEIEGLPTDDECGFDSEDDLSEWSGDGSTFDPSLGLDRFPLHEFEVEEV